MASRALILQQKTSRPVQFEITEPARTAVSAWIARSKLKAEDFLFPSRIHASPHLSIRQYARIVILGFFSWDWTLPTMHWLAVFFAVVPVAVEVLA
jgi:hypothetical protein